MISSNSYKRDYHDILPVQGINRDLWRLVKARAAAEGKTVGEVLNELIDEYQRDSGREIGLPLGSTSYETDPRHLLPIRGIDRDLWRWLKAQSVLEGRYMGEIVNSLIERQRDSGGTSG